MIVSDKNQSLFFYTQILRHSKYAIKPLAKVVHKKYILTAFINVKICIKCNNYFV